MKKCDCRIRKWLAALLALTMLSAAFPISAGAAKVYTGDFSAVVYTGAVDVYADAGLTRRVGTIDQATVLTVSAFSDGVAYITLYGHSGFVDASALRTVAELAQPAVVRYDTRVYQRPDTSSNSGALAAGSTLNLLGTVGDWALVERGGIGGFTYVGALYVEGEDQPAPTAAPGGNSIPGTVISVTCPIYASNSTNSTKIGSLPSNTQLNVLAVSGGWAYIEWNGNYGFCQVGNLIPTQSLSTYMDGTVVTACDVYARASESSTYLGRMEPGTQVTVYSISDGWAFFRMAEYFGYCRVSNLMPGHVSTDPTPAPSATATPSPSLGAYIPGIVTADRVDIYAAASTSSQQLGYLPKDTIVNVYGVSGGWAYIEWNGNFGYCAVSALEPYSGQTSGLPDGYREETFSATVVTTGARFYERDSTSSANVAVPMGTNVTVGGYNAEWAYVNLNGTLGFIRISDLSRTNYSTLQNGSSGSAVESLETALLLLGYLDSNPGTSYTGYTESAVKLFQKACGMAQTGIADEATQRVLFSGNAPWCDLFSKTYSSGDSGSNVSRLQLRLFALGYLSKSSSVDGEYGSTTANAVRLFQQANGLSVTGSIDANTLRQMYTTGAVRLPSGQAPADTNSGGKEPNGDGQTNNATWIADGLKSETTSFSSSMSNAEKLEYAIYYAQNQLGKPYVYGATGSSSFDCSGLTYASFRQIKVTLPRTAQSQGYDDDFQKISSVSSLRRGDLVFFNTVSDSDQCDHTGIYLGDGWFIHASSGQGRVVVSTLASGYYNGVFSWGRRVLG